VTDCDKTVDKFHFLKNHKGRCAVGWRSITQAVPPSLRASRMELSLVPRRFCNQYVNPSNYPVLEGFNTSICEQRFVHFGKYKFVFRHLNEVRSSRMLLEVVNADHEFRRLGLLTPPKKSSRRS